MKRSRFYDKYYEGYVTKQIDDGESIRTVRVYTGVYYKADLEKGIGVFLRLIYLALFITAAILTYLAAARPIEFNSSTICAVLLCLNALAEILLILPVISYSISPKEMTKYQYESSSVKITQYGKFGVLTLGASFAASVFLAHDILCVIEYLLAAAAVFMMCFIESKVNYIKIKSENYEEAGDKASDEEPVE